MFSSSANGTEVTQQKHDAHAEPCRPSGDNHDHRRSFAKPVGGCAECEVQSKVKYPTVVAIGTVTFTAQRGGCGMSDDHRSPQLRAELRVKSTCATAETEK
jgi:hypothetical protein